MFEIGIGFAIGITVGLALVGVILSLYLLYRLPEDMKKAFEQSFNQGLSGTSVNVEEMASKIETDLTDIADFVEDFSHNVKNIMK